MRVIRQCLFTAAVLSVALWIGGVASDPVSLGRLPGGRSDMELQRVVFAHRHGARTPVANVNGSCDQLGCGVLTLQGALMLKSLGETMRAAYNDILPAFYDTRVIKVTSDDSDRVIQSAAAFAEGLFAFNSTAMGGVLPATHTDSALSCPGIDPWSGTPTFKLHTVPMGIGAILNITGPALQIISKDEVIAIGQEMGLWWLECDVVPAACVAEEVDFLESIKTEGKLSLYPLGEKYLPQLQQVRRLAFGALEGAYDIDKKDNFFEQAGWPGATLLTAMLEDAKSENLALSEFSGHDTTLMPLYAAMGNLSGFQYPDFATAVVFEVWTGAKEKANPGAKKTQSGRSTMNDGAERIAALASRIANRGKQQQGETAMEKAGDGAALYIRPLVGRCGQLPFQHNYTFEPYTIFCTSYNGTTYATSDMCRLDDFMRYATSRIAADPCYAWPPDLQDADCVPSTSTGAPNYGSECYDYRKNCPGACGSGYYMTPQYACIPLPTSAVVSHRR